MPARAGFGDFPVFIESEEISTDNREKWSNSIEEDRYHIITIMKEGYQLWQRKVEFTDDLVINASLRNMSGPSQIAGDS